MKRKFCLAFIYTPFVLCLLYFLQWSYKRGSEKTFKVEKVTVSNSDVPDKNSAPKTIVKMDNEENTLGLSLPKKSQAVERTAELPLTKPEPIKTTQPPAKTNPPIKTTTPKTMESTKSQEEKCSLWKKVTKQDFPKHPRIQLNPNKFIYPGLKWGPNNEVIGFLQTVYVAIRLNRSLVIPNFKAHGMNGGGSVPAHQRLDVDRLCSLVRCVSVDTMRQACGPTFDVALQASMVQTYELREYEQQTNMKILLSSDEEAKLNFGRAVRIRLLDGGQSIPTIPALPGKEYSIRYLFPWLPMDEKSMLKALGTPARCAIYTSVFASLNYSMINFSGFPLDTSFVNVSKIPDNILFSAVWDSIRRPPCIAEAAKAYVDRFLNNNFIAIHWRFAQDWKTVLCMNKAVTFPIIVPRTCAALQTATVQTIAERIVKKVNRKNDLSGPPVFIYIATPPTINNFKENLYKEVMKKLPYLSRPEKEMQGFINEEYEPCWKKAEWTNLGEMYSLIEMEIMRLSSVFFYSGGSTWSQIIVPDHVKKGMDGKYVAKPRFDVNDIPLELW